MRAQFPLSELMLIVEKRSEANRRDVIFSFITTKKLAKDFRNLIIKYGRSIQQ